MTRITEAEARRLLRGLLRAAPTPKRRTKKATTTTATPPPRTPSKGEAALAEALALHGADLGAPALEYEFARHIGRRWRFDFAWPGAFVAAEVDGGQWKAGGGRHNTDEDRTKLNQAAALGWRVLRFSPAQVKRDPAGCVAVIRKALEVLP